MNKYQFKNIFSLLLAPSMFIAFPGSFMLTSDPVSFVFFQKSYLMLLLVTFTIIALLIFTSLQNMLEDTVKSSNFASGATTIALVALGLNLAFRFIRFPQNTSMEYTPTTFFVYNFLIGLALSVVISGLLGWGISRILKNTKI